MTRALHLRTYSDIRGDPLKNGFENNLIYIPKEGIIAGYINVDEKKGFLVNKTGERKYIRSITESLSNTDQKKEPAFNLINHIENISDLDIRKLIHNKMISEVELIHPYKGFTQHLLRILTNEEIRTTKPLDNPYGIEKLSEKYLERLLI